MTNVEDKKQALQEATQKKNELGKYAAEIPSLKRKLIQDLAGTTSKTSRKELKSKLDDLVLDEEIVPLQLEEAQYRELEARVQANAAEIKELESQASPLREEAAEAKTKREYWGKIEAENQQKATNLGYQIQKLQNENQRLRREVDTARQKAAQRQEQQEKDRQGLQPRVV